MAAVLRAASVGLSDGRAVAGVLVLGKFFRDVLSKHTFEHGPATSSVWSTPSYDPETNTLFFGTDVNTAPRQPTADNPKLHTEDSCALVALDAATAKRKWNTQKGALFQPLPDV